MSAAKIREILDKLTSAVLMAFFILLLLIFVLVFLINQGWQHPFQSLRAKTEMRIFLEETYPGQDLRIGFPTYNLIMSEFSTFVKDGEGQVLFGLSYTENSGVTECKALQTKDGHYYLAAE